MSYKINGKPATAAEARRTIQEAVPNGGVEFLENAVRNSRTAGLASVALHVGDRFTLEIIFNE